MFGAKASKRSLCEFSFQCQLGEIRWQIPGCPAPLPVVFCLRQCLGVPVGVVGGSCHSAALADTVTAEAAREGETVGFWSQSDKNYLKSHIPIFSIPSTAEFSLKSRIHCWACVPFTNTIRVHIVYATYHRNLYV